MALDTRQKLFFFTGLVIALYGLALTIVGLWSLNYTVHGASGASMWCGIVIIMCGVGNIIISLDSDEKDSIGGFSVGALVGNMIAMLMGILVIAFATWGSFDHLEEGIEYAVTEPSIDVYITVVLMGIFVMILSLIAMMFDCCCRGPSGLMGGPVPQQPQPYPYHGGAYPQGYAMQ